MVDHGNGTPPAAAEAAERQRNTNDSCSALDMEPELNLREDEGVEEDGETSEVSDDGESEREDDYNFQFEGEMDPLSFVEGEDTSRLPLYEVFQRIEDQYKALAANKRPAPDNAERYCVGFFLLLYKLNTLSKSAKIGYIDFCICNGIVVEHLLRD